MIAPEIREDIDEIELITKGKKSPLVTLQDIKGDMHIHTNWSDGINSIEEIVRYLKKHFNYEYIVITDHPRVSRISNGKEEKKIVEQIEKIKLLNERLGEEFIKTGIEVTILADGRLDISDEILSQLDWVTASIHQNTNRDSTSRLISACRNSFVYCVGHPPGRLIGSRESYKVDVEALLEVAFITNTVVEINAQDQRMDFNAEFARKACSKGVKLAINTDSHNLTHFNYMKMGVSIARRAWCTPEDIINTKSWSSIRENKRLKFLAKPTCT